MCVIAVKKRGVRFPKKAYLENCFDNNPDGAGFMYSYGGRVHIKKGFATFGEFWKRLGECRKVTGDDAAYVMHFRIATQGFELSMTHPFPLTDKIPLMKKLEVSCSVGVAHNGIIPITSDGSKDYSDTMRFIQLYLVNLVRSRRWKDDPNIIAAIEGLIVGSRLSVMDSDGDTTELGMGWVEHGGVLYSNSSYAYAVPKCQTPKHLRLFGGTCRDWEKYKEMGRYYFDDDDCPFVCEGDASYCEECYAMGFCPYVCGLEEGLYG